jgi:hypothetical protein
MSTLTRMALYLNLATKRIKEAGGSLSYIANKTDKKVKVPGDEGQQETQVLYLGGIQPRLFIANNDDKDTETQRELMNLLGIDNIGLFNDHIDRFQGCALKRAKGEYSGGRTPKEELLYSLVGLKKTDAADLKNFDFGKTVVNDTVGTGGDLAGVFGNLVFVTGSYEGSGGDTLHAEQKLVALVLKNVAKLRKYRRLTVAGCKTACGTCAKALADAAGSLENEGLPLFWTDDAAVKKARTDAKLSPDDPKDIRMLNVKAYLK